MSAKISRRGFFGLFGAAAAAAAVEAVAPTYFFSPIGGWKSDVIVHPDPFAEYLNFSEIAASHPQPLYDKRFLEILKAQTPFVRLAQSRPIPVTKGKYLTFSSVGL